MEAKIKLKFEREYEVVMVELERLNKRAYELKQILMEDEK